MTTKSGQHKITQAQIRKTLVEFGLSTIDADVYLVATTLPPLPVSQLANKCGLTRPNMYNVLARLSKFGLVKNITTSNGKLVEIAHPAELFTLYERKKSELLSKEKDLSSIVDSLLENSFSGPTIKPRVVYYEGLESVRNMYLQSINNNKEKLVRGATDKNIIDVLGHDFIMDYIEKRKNRGIRTRNLQSLPMKEFTKIYGTDFKSYLRETRITPKTVNYDCMTIIYDNTVLFITLRNELFGTLIESVDFSNVMKSWFETLWDISKTK